MDGLVGIGRVFHPVQFAIGTEGNDGLDKDLSLADPGEALEGGETIDDFLEGFPMVIREQVIAFLDEANDRMLTAAS